MKTIKELYPDLGDEPFNGVYDYSPLIESIAPIVIQADDHDYQGDSRILFFHENRYGYLQFGWGSCSGCDALQACESISQIEALRDELVSQIRWFNTKEETLEFFNNHDWKADYSYKQEEQEKFIQKVKNFLTEAIDKVSLQSQSHQLKQILKKE